MDDRGEEAKVVPLRPVPRLTIREKLPRHSDLALEHAFREGFWIGAGVALFIALVGFIVFEIHRGP